MFGTRWFLQDSAGATSPTYLVLNSDGTTNNYAPDHCWDSSIARWTKTTTAGASIDTVTFLGPDIHDLILCPPPPPSSFPLLLRDVPYGVQLEGDRLTLTHQADESEVHHETLTFVARG